MSPSRPVSRLPWLQRLPHGSTTASVSRGWPAMRSAMFLIRALRSWSPPTSRRKPEGGCLRNWVSVPPIKPASQWLSVRRSARGSVRPTRLRCWLTVRFRCWLSTLTTTQSVAPLSPFRRGANLRVRRSRHRACSRRLSQRRHRTSLSSRHGSDPASPASRVRDRS